jgi:hypothetical protein
MTIRNQQTTGFFDSLSNPAFEDGKCPGLIGIEIEGVPSRVSVRKLWLKKLA